MVGTRIDCLEYRLDPPEQLAQIVLRALPAFVASVYSAATAVLGTIPHTRRLALLDSLAERPRAALERYLEHTEVIETRWLVLRVLGVSGGAVALYPVAPSPAALWTMVIVLCAYAVPSQLLSAFSRRYAE